MSAVLLWMDPAGPTMSMLDGSASATTGPSPRMSVVTRECGQARFGVGGQTDDVTVELICSGAKIRCRTASSQLEPPTALITSPATTYIVLL